MHPMHDLYRCWSPFVNLWHVNQCIWCPQHIWWQYYWVISTWLVQSCSDVFCLTLVAIESYFAAFSSDCNKDSASLIHWEINERSSTKLRSVRILEGMEWYGEVSKGVILTQCCREKYAEYRTCLWERYECTFLPKLWVN